MPREFRTTDVYSPTGDQPRAIDEIAASVADGNRFQTLLGATGTGKTATMAWIIEKTQRPRAGGCWPRLGTWKT